jgi:predicted ribosomally synthesized peptide with nif11-like leader
MLGRLQSPAMALDQLKAFLAVVQDDPALRQAIRAAATADDVAQIGAGLGYSFSGDELLRLSGKRVGRVTVRKNDLPGEYN